MSPAPGGTIRVLIADDDPALREAIAGLLADESSIHLVAAARDAHEAIALAARERPDVALIDVRMPGGGGPYATREIRDHSAETAVVALSADGNRDSVFRMLAAGAVSYLVKGGEAGEVIETIRRAARREASLSGAVTGHVVGKVSRDLRAEQRTAESLKEIESRVRAALEGDVLRIVYQPLMTLDGRRLVGYEALARFSLEPRRSPDLWFRDAEQVGRRTELEVEAIARALHGLRSMPEGVLLSLNASPETIVAGAIDAVLTGVDVSRIVLEVTEQAPIADYDEFAGALETLRSNGLQLAVDDAGAGFASLRHILQLAPDLIKLDRSWIEDVDSNRASRSLAAAFVGFATEVDTLVLAEGIEREVQFDTLLDLGVTLGQGYLLGRPGPLR